MDFYETKTPAASDFKKELFVVEQVGNEDPKCGTPYVLEKLLPMTILEMHLPAEGEVKAQQRVANIDKYRVHPCKKKKMHSKHFWIGLVYKTLL